MNNKLPFLLFFSMHQLIKVNISIEYFELNKLY